jgi:hypothetical protein
MAEEPSLPSFIFDDLKHGGALSSKANVRHLEPDETLSELRSGNRNSKAILFFPHYQFNIAFNNCIPVRIPNEEILFQDVILVAKKSAFTEQELFQLDIAVRNVWLEMLNKQNAMQAGIHSITMDRDLTDYMIRVSGLHNLCDYPVI